jgi:hypothetical protein
MPVTKAIERRFPGVRCRTRPRGTFQDRTSMERILLAVFLHENRNQGLAAPFALSFDVTFVDGVRLAGIRRVRGRPGTIAPTPVVVQVDV